MRTITRAVFAALAAVAVASAARAEAQPFSQEVVVKSLASLSGAEQQISVDLRDTDIVDILTFLGKKAGVNVVASPSIAGRVTLSLADVTVENALQIILISNNLAYRRLANILYVMKEEEYTVLYGETYRDQRIVRIIPLQYVQPAIAATFLGNVKSTVGRIIVDDGTGTLVLMDVPEKVALMEEVLKNLDITSVVRATPVETKVFDLKYAKVENIQAEVAKALTPVGKLQGDTASNTLVISDVPARMGYVTQVVQSFDRKIRQVFIDTKMIQVRLQNKYQMGIDWENQIWKEKLNDLALTGTFPVASTATNFLKFSIGNLGRDKYNIIIKALHTFGDTETLAGPQLAVVNGEEAEILIGTKEAYVTSTVSQASSTTTTSEDVTFVDVGVKLKVKPEINQDGFVKLTISPEVSSVGRTLTTANNNQIPIVDTTTSTTTVLVKDGYTVIIGGLMKDEIKKTVKKIPLLGDIPVLGGAFRNMDDERIKTELIVFLTPHIVSGDEENPYLTASGREFYPVRDPQSFLGASGKIDGEAGKPADKDKGPKKGGTMP